MQRRLRSDLLMFHAGGMAVLCERRGAVCRYCFFVRPTIKNCLLMIEDRYGCFQENDG